MKLPFSLNQQRKWVVAGAGLLALFFLFLLYVPLGSRLGGMGRELSKLSAELNTARGMILSAQTMGVELLFLPTQKELSLVMDEVTDRGKRLGIDFRSIRPQEIEAGPSGYSFVPIEMTLASSYKELGQFIGALRSLERGVVVVDRFEVDRDKDLFPKLNCRLRVKVVLHSP